jgi:uncharacterized protein
MLRAMSPWHDPEHDLRSIADLRQHYPQPQRPAAAATLDKECDHVHPLYRRFVEAAPFCVMATRQAGGALDLSPRGDAAPAELVRVVDEGRTLLLPDRRGNNRIDSLRNLVADPEIGLLFLIPGVGEAIRVQGRARISRQPQLLADFAVNGQPPRAVLVVAVHKVFFQCARAVARSRLWAADAQIERASLPSTGSLLAALSSGFDAAAYDQALPTRQQATLY